MTVQAPVFPRPAKPGKVQAIAVLTLISGLSNILWPLFLWVLAGTLTLFIGCLCLPLFAPPIVLGVFELVYAFKLLPDPIRPVRPSTPIAVLEIAAVLTGNLLALLAGVVALILYGEPEVREYFAGFDPEAAPAAAQAAPVPPVPVDRPQPAAQSVQPIVEPAAAPAPVEPAAPSAPAPAEPPGPIEPPAARRRTAARSKAAPKPAAKKTAAKTAPAKPGKPTPSAARPKPARPAARKPAKPEK